MFLNNELAIADALARHAGTMALALRDKLTITYKPDDQGPVTNADIEIDQYITGQLAKDFPEDRIISEESYRESDPPIGGGRTWFVDPIDGTASYILGNDDFVIMIGLAIDGVARLGVVFDPNTDSLWRGIVDEHQMSMLSEKLVGKNLLLKNVAPNDKMPTKLTLIASRMHRSRRQDEMIRRLKPKRVIYRSSVGLKGMMISEGSADLYVAWSSRIKMWDTCAPSAILHAAGCHISFVDGSAMSFMGPIDHGRPIQMSHFTPNQQLLSELQNIAAS